MKGTAAGLGVRGAEGGLSWACVTPAWRVGKAVVMMVMKVGVVVLDNDEDEDDGDKGGSDVDIGTIALFSSPPWAGAATMPVDGLLLLLLLLLVVLLLLLVGWDWLLKVVNVAICCVVDVVVIELGVTASLGIAVQRRPSMEVRKAPAGRLFDAISFGQSLSKQTSAMPVARAGNNIQEKRKESKNTGLYGR